MSNIIRETKLISKTLNNHSKINGKKIHISTEEKHSSDTEFSQKNHLLAYIDGDTRWKPKSNNLDINRNKTRDKIKFHHNPFLDKYQHRKRLQK
jgi:hypothetical protein